jgi:hypothetical protein
MIFSGKTIDLVLQSSKTRYNIFRSVESKMGQPFSFCGIGTDSRGVWLRGDLLRLVNRGVVSMREWISVISGNRNDWLRALVSVALCRSGSPEIPRSFQSCVESLNERGIVEALGFFGESFSIVLATGLRGRWKGGLGLAYRSRNALRGLSGTSLCLSRGVEVDLKSLSRSAAKSVFILYFLKLSAFESRLLISPKSESEAERP